MATPTLAPTLTPSTLRSSLDDLTVKSEYAGDADNYITFLHPGYDDRGGHSILFRLNAFDREGGGLHFGTALAACRIVAGNSEDGYFTLQRGGPKIDLQYDELLRERKYYFYNPDVQDEQYPVYRSFADWSFPHDNFPGEWSSMNNSGNGRAPPSASSLTAFVSARDQCCRVSETRGSDYFTRAHLIPRSEKDWFQKSGMQIYNLNPRLSGDSIHNDVRNAIALRSDINLAFDDQKFVIVPKQSKWVIQFLGLTNNLGHEFHNTHIRLKGIASQFLYARFAWTIFPLLSQFVSAVVPRNLLVRLPNGDETSKTFTFEEIMADAVVSRSRNASSRKRQRTNPEEGQVTVTQTFLENDWSTSQVENSERATTLPSVCSLESPTQSIPSWEVLRRKQRPTDLSLYCCNYEKAEADARAGRPGNPRWGGGYLCDQCLGIEYLEDRDKDVEEVASWDD